MSICDLKVILLSVTRLKSQQKHLTKTNNALIICPEVIHVKGFILRGAWIWSEGFKEVLLFLFQCFWSKIWENLPQWRRTRKGWEVNKIFMNHPLGTVNKRKYFESLASGDRKISPTSLWGNKRLSSHLCRVRILSCLFPHKKHAYRRV